QFKNVEVKQPNIGEVKPSAVTAEDTFSISSYKAQIRSEWNSKISRSSLSAEEEAKARMPQRLGLHFVWGCEIIEMRIKRDEWKPPKGVLRTLAVALNTAQYMDASDISERHRGSILESIRDMNECCNVPDWLLNILLGYGNPSAAQWTNIPDLLETVDFKDKFLDSDHLKQSFPDYQNAVLPSSNQLLNLPPSPQLPAQPHHAFSIALCQLSIVLFTPPSVNKLYWRPFHLKGSITDADGEKEKLIVEAYMPPDPVPYPQDHARQNSVRFTPIQIEAITSGTARTYNSCGSVQILIVLYHNCPTQRTLIITHSNQALNDLFEKIMQLATDLDFSWHGRVNVTLVRCLELLNEVEKLARSHLSYYLDCLIFIISSLNLFQLVYQLTSKSELLKSFYTMFGVYHILFELVSTLMRFTDAHSTNLKG
ncbi:hypothetical protein UlMin_007441, partial [Ulmus minor]